MVAALSALLILHGYCFARRDRDFSFMHQATRAPMVSYYDYIIVGGGTAGCALAATLSQSSSVLLERGGSPFGNPNTTNLSAFGAALSDLSRKSPSQRFVSEDGVINARARVLGGGSALNAGFSSRAGSEFIANAGWEAKLVNESYRWVERMVVFHPPLRQCPQLLMLSGLGPEKHLEAHNISVVLDLPLVGQRMSDNPMNAVFVPSPRPVEVSLIQVVGITHNRIYIEGASGENFARETKRTRDFGMFSPKIGHLSTSPPKQRTKEALNRAKEAMRFLPRSAFLGGFILEKIMGPLSSGHLELRSTNSNHNPAVTFNYFQDPGDLEKCVEGIKIIEKVIESRSFSRFRYNHLPITTLLNMTANSPVNLLPKHANASRSFEQFCRDTVTTIWHYHGGCQVDKVVDHDYKVIGVDSLQVIDGSTFDYSLGTNPQATVMMLGSYMGVKMLHERSANMIPDSN
ncbi:hypothetical protein L1987_09759 [Smallanthus sonchifolius]|uniref:Uncharacterized protein n=1 Tax=Smallanthus sonchifolius TaxID=185202 RepID=A0ACB9JQB2_9ASTR|nr:hypothetical protein L1987_09759 [Smallanthus sonchifolius]